MLLFALHGVALCHSDEHLNFVPDEFVEDTAWGENGPEHHRRFERRAESKPEMKAVLNVIQQVTEQDAFAATSSAYEQCYAVWFHLARMELLDA
jgi:hypothetical protein